MILHTKSFEPRIFDLLRQHDQSIEAVKSDLEQNVAVLETSIAETNAQVNVSKCQMT